MKKLILLAAIVTVLASCTENYSNGERIGVITQLSNTGVFWKSYEGHLNVTQTGMNSSVPFDFSIDNDHEDPKLVKTLLEAAQNGWKVKLIYHETRGKNFFNNRGETDHFIQSVEVLDKNMASLFNNKAQPAREGRIIDTIYVVIDKSQLKKK